MLPNYKIEKELSRKGFKIICGVDEVGRGALAGPLVVSAVILGKNKKIYKIRDSKKLTLKNREKLNSSILKNVLDYSIGEVSAKEIDKFGLSKAIKLAGKRCIKKLKIIPDIIILDGKWNYLGNIIKVKTITKGDEKSISIASASIIGKVKRDRALFIYHKKYPQYNFLKNKGYATKEHKKAIKKYGFSQIHRKSFKIK